MVLESIDRLRQKGFVIGEEAILKGLSTVTWQGRFEVLSRNPLVIVDGAHNPNGVEALVETIEEVFPHKKINFLIGVMEEKNHHEMLKRISPLAKRFIATMPPDERALDKEKLTEEIRGYFAGPVDSFEKVQDALKFALETTDGILICFGSLYQVSEIRDYSTPEGETKEKLCIMKDGEWLYDV